MGFSGFKTGKTTKKVNVKFNQMANEKNEQVEEKKIKEHLDFMVSIGLLEKKNDSYFEPKIVKDFTEEQRQFILELQLRFRGRK